MEVFNNILCKLPTPCQVQRELASPNLAINLFLTIKTYFISSLSNLKLPDREFAIRKVPCVNINVIWDQTCLRFCTKLGGVAENQNVHIQFVQIPKESFCGNNKKKGWLSPQTFGFYVPLVVLMKRLTFLSPLSCSYLLILIKFRLDTESLILSLKFIAVVDLFKFKVIVDLC